MLKVFELCLSSPTVSKFFTLLFLPFSMVSEPFHRWGGAFSTLGAPFGVRFRRLNRFWTVRYPGVPCSTGSRCWRVATLCMLCPVCLPWLLYSVLCPVLCFLCVLCCARVCLCLAYAMCPLRVFLMCSQVILVIFLASSPNDPPFY